MAYNTNKLSILLICLIISSCATAPSYRVHPQAEKRLQTTKTIMVIPLDISVYQLTAGGIKEKMDEWCTQAKKNILTAVEEELKARPFLSVITFPETSLSEDQKSNLDETQALFNAVNSSIITHTYGPPQQLFQEKIKDFDYSLGTEVKMLSEQADALLFIRGVDHISTAGRKALQTGGIILGALVGVIPVIPSGATFVNIALVDANTGSILWYNFHGSSGSCDLRDPLITSKLIKELFMDFPHK